MSRRWMRYGREVLARGLTRATHRIHSLPVVVLMPHSRCNCRCVMCDIWKANQNKVELSPQDLEVHLPALRKLAVGWVVLSGGEPLMHANLWTLCRLLRGLEARITLLSTGLLLRRHARQVVDWCDHVIVSLDGGPPVHDAIRNVPRAYDQLAQGVVALRALAPRFPVTARCVVQRRNYHDLPNVIAAARELGLDQLSFLAADVSTQAFNRSTPWDQERAAEVALDAEEARRFGELVEELVVRHAQDFASGFIAESPVKMRRMARDFKARTVGGALTRRRCNAPWVSTVVEADGTVRPCFFHRSLGNLGQSSLEEILNSEEAVTFRRQLDVRTDSICRQCVCTLQLSPWQSPTT